MPAAFSRTLRSLKADGPRRRTLALLAAGAVVGLWLAWFLLGAVAVYEVADQARLEVEVAPHPVSAAVAGQVVTTDLELGREVTRGEVLIELDAQKERLALEEASARREGLRQQIAALRREIQVGKDAADAKRKAQTVAIAEKRAQVSAAEGRADLAEKQARNLAKLREGGAASDDAVQEAQSKARSQRAAASSLALATSRAEEELDADQLDRAAALAKLESEVVQLESAASVEDATIRRLEREVELRRIRAPVDGRVDSASDLRAGAVVRAAEELGSIVPRGKPRVVAFFPVAAVGRLRPGQSARLRLDGFPWTQFGMPLASVDDVGTEPSRGRVRVELSLDLESAPAIPLEHGLTGSVEVEVERLSPAEVVLRAAGRVLSPKGRASSEDAPAEGS